MEADRLLNARWPPDLDPADVPFRTRTITVLTRQGYFDDPTLFDTLTETEVLSWTNAGPKTVADIRETGNAAIGLHCDQAAQLPRLRADMAVVAGTPWARHIWHRDPRFAEYLPECDATVNDVAAIGAEEDQWRLWGNLEALRAALTAQAARTLGDAVAEYVEAIGRQHDHRLEVLLARTGLGGQDPITGVEAARRLGVSPQRMTQIVHALCRNRDHAAPPGGVWMPQVAKAEQLGWPEGYTPGGVKATREFFGW